MGLEYERKYKATPQALDRLEQSLGQAGTQIRMETTYFDTPDRSFSARHWTVRRRMENERSVCTFKFPTDGIGRGEFEIQSPSLEAAIPELCKLSGKEELGSLATAGLVPVCGARFTRTAITMAVGSTLVEVALDRGVLLGGGKQIPLFEAEVELKAGNPADVDRFGTYLQVNFDLQPEPYSKFARANALAQGVI